VYPRDPVDAMRLLVFPKQVVDLPDGFFDLILQFSPGVPDFPQFLAQAVDGFGVLYVFDPADDDLRAAIDVFGGWSSFTPWWAFSGGVGVLGPV
jgi:hypothetical protein